MKMIFCWRWIFYDWLFFVHVDSYLICHESEPKSFYFFLDFIIFPVLYYIYDNMTFAVVYSIYCTFYWVYIKFFLFLIALLVTLCVCMCNSLQVYKRSSEICMQLYEKEIFTDTSFLHIYGLTIEFPNLLLLFIFLQFSPWEFYLLTVFFTIKSTGYQMLI